MILFTGFPAAFAAIMTSLNLPITLMLVGIALRGSAFSFRSYGAGDAHTRREWGRIFAIASLITPLLLGATIGAIASGRIPGRPHLFSDFITSWFTSFCLSVGIFALVLFAYLSATHATCELDDPEHDDEDLVRGFPRAIASAIAAGVMAGAVLLLSIDGAPRIWLGFTHRIWTWPVIWQRPFWHWRHSMLCGRGATKLRASALPARLR